MDRKANSLGVPILTKYASKCKPHTNLEINTISNLMDSLEDEQSDCPVNSGNDIEPNELVEQICKDSK